MDQDEIAEEAASEEFFAQAKTDRARTFLPKIRHH